MGLMNTWEKFSKWNWKTWGNKLRPTYEKIDEWDLPDSIKESCKHLWLLIPVALKDALYKMATAVFEKAKELKDVNLDDVTKAIASFLESLAEKLKK